MNRSSGVLIRQLSKLYLFYIKVFTDVSFSLHLQVNSVRSFISVSFYLRSFIYWRPAGCFCFVCLFIGLFGVVVCVFFFCMLVCFVCLCFFVVVVILFFPEGES